MSAFSVLKGLFGIADPDNPTRVLKPNADGSINTVSGGGSAGGIHAEDSASADGDALVGIALVRTDSLSSGAGVGANGDYAFGRVNNYGSQWATLADNSGVPVDFSGITTIARLLSSAATTNATSVKASAGRYYWIRGRNNRASSVFLKIYNKASAPTVGTDTPVDTIELVASQPFVLDFPAGVALATGIAFAMTTAAADADTGAVASGDITCLSIGYA